MSLHEWLAQQRRDRAENGLTRRLRPRDPASTLIDLAGNDYLGLATDPRVAAAAAEAAHQWGAGAGASRLVTGTLDIHTRLEAELARFTDRPAALVFSTGYHANLATVSALSDTDTLVVSDAHIHASMVDACRLARHGGLVVVPHNNLEAITDALRNRSQARALVLVESVYSVIGDAAPLPELTALTSRYDATLVVDEAHAIGVAGIGGRGLVAARGLGHEPNIVSTMTLSKSLGSQGGAVIATPDVLEHLVNTARPFIYDTGLAPPAAAAALASLAIIESTPELPHRALMIAGRMADALGAKHPAGAVLSVPMAGPSEALLAQAGFAQDGFGVGCFRPPSVPDETSRLRLTARASLTDEQVETVVDRLALVASIR